MRAIKIHRGRFFEVTKLISLPILFVCCFGSGSSWAGDDDTAGCKLTVAWDPYEPYSYSDGSDTPVGFDIEVVSKVAGMIGCSLTFIELEWGDVLTALQNGRADIAIGTGYHTDRATWSYYSESYRKEILGLLIRDGTAGEFAGGSLDEIFRTGFIFGKTNDDTYDQDENSVFERYPTQVRGRVSEEQNIGRLLAGSIDGILIEVNVAGALVRKMDAAQKVEFHPLTFEAGDYRLQLSKKTVAADGLAQVNEAIQQLKSDGWFARTVGKYGVN